MEFTTIEVPISLLSSCFLVCQVIALNTFPRAFGVIPNPKYHSIFTAFVQSFLRRSAMRKFFICCLSVCCFILSTSASEMIESKERSRDVGWVPS